VHDRPRGLGQLHRRDADAPGRGMHQHLLACLKRAVAVQCRPSRRVVDRDRGALLEAHRVRQRDSVVGVGVDDLGIAAETRSGQHPLADSRRIDAVTDGFDRPGHLVADDAGHLGRIGVQPDPSEMVGEVHARCMHRDPHLAGGWWRRVGTVLHLEDRRGTVLGDDNRAHGYT
jgi:hypothetical protein